MVFNIKYLLHIFHSVGCTPSCQNGVCLSGVCQCDPGWTGSTCSIRGMYSRMHKCAQALWLILLFQQYVKFLHTVGCSPSCQNGICLNSIGRCSCDLGYTGTSCDRGLHTINIHYMQLQSCTILHKLNRILCLASFKLALI